MGFLLANIYDGVALVKLFGWLENNIDKVKITELDVSEKLLNIKKERSGFLYPSFETIAAYGENGAEVHHRSAEKDIKRDNLLLLDSGSQYLFGTTDITRTLHFGIPTEEQKNAYTLVLKGQLSAQMLKAPGTRFSRLIQDLPRIHLWKDEKDYGHGTSHGVGFYLNVHESPPSFNGDEMKPMQVFSIEPGVYEDKWGIRIEDVFVSIKSGKYLSTAILSYVPLHLSLINWNLLNNSEIEYLDDYSKIVYDLLRDYVDGEGLKYLEDNTNIWKYINNNLFH